MIEPQHPALSIRRQCELLGLNRATYYYQPATESAENLHLMRLIDAQYLKTPFYGYPRMTAYLRAAGYPVNHKRVARLMRLMGYRRSIRSPVRSPTPRNIACIRICCATWSITHPNQVWSADITYIPLQRGFMYLVAVIDWYSRYVLAWQLSNTLDGQFCLDGLETALAQATPEIFNTDQGVQFTARAFTTRVEAAGVRVSMDGRGRALDNVFIERLWRSLKYEDIYIRDYTFGAGARSGLTALLPLLQSRTSASKLSLSSAS